MTKQMEKYIQMFMVMSEDALDQAIQKLSDEEKVKLLKVMIMAMRNTPIK